MIRGGHKGSQPLNGADATALIGICQDWLKEHKDCCSDAAGDLRAQLREAGYNTERDED